MTATDVGASAPRRDYRWIGVAEAARLLGLSVRELYRAINHGLLPAYRIDAQVRLLRHEVEEFRTRHPDIGGPAA